MNINAKFYKTKNNFYCGYIDSRPNAIFGHVRERARQKSVNDTVNCKSITFMLVILGLTAS